ncbi:TIGR01777 family oxidoreductase [Rhabdothermincola salaria]|uniref:TIGR01777 family oxidoreductase n=1 Tax=Rhabdothermincola salaria TaxID=2903142 RepID=UPI001E4F670C|nr:TIGR01777 family oxidoreductase [Rhabdothermincola salaria]MCD9623412.1 TIGR01777 family oxidoreductase [Rhabdothermincola salaria]
MRIAITGSTGLIGTALGRSLAADGHEVVPVVRRPLTAGEVGISWDPSGGTIDTAALEGLDAVVHLAGAGIGDKRWTDEYKRTILESRTKGTDVLARALAGLSDPPSVLVSASAIGYYGDTGDSAVTEQAPAGDDFLADVCVQWEGAAAPATEAGIRVVHPRTGIVLSPEGGALAKLLPLFKVGLGGRMGSGQQWWSWITLPDEVAAIRHLIDHDVSGPVNLTAPDPATNSQLTKVLGSVLHRPTLVPVPSFGPKLLLGGELADALLFNSQRVLPGVLDAQGFSFAHPDLEGALRALLDRPADDAAA